VTSSSIGVTVVNLRAMKGCEGGIAVFIFNILVSLSGQLCVRAVLYNGKYSPVGLAVEKWLGGCPEAVSAIFGKDKYVCCFCQESNDDPTGIMRWQITILGVSRQRGDSHCEES